MADLIDRQAAIDALKAIRYGLWEIDIPFSTVPEYVEHHEQIKNMMEITGGWIKKLEEQPTADVVDVKHGKWIWQGSISEGCWICSECNHKFYQGYGNENFCPNCGAKMDGKETEDEH